MCSGSIIMVKLCHSRCVVPLSQCAFSLPADELSACWVCGVKLTDVLASLRSHSTSKITLSEEFSSHSTFWRHHQGFGVLHHQGFGVLHHQGFGVLHQAVNCNSGSRLGGLFAVSVTAHVLCISSCLVPVHVQISL